MAGNCLINIDQNYINSLIGVVQSGHANLALTAKNKKEFGLNNGSGASYFKCLTDVSNILFYLTFWDVDNDDCYFAHYLKEKAMNCINFTESDITTAAMTRSILSEGGIIFLDEEFSQYVQQQ